MNGSSTIIIAEAGVNHNGSIELAKRLIDVAAEAKADYVKFQTFIAEKNISVHAVKANYQIQNSKDADESQLEMVRKLELTVEAHIELIEYCKEKQIKFLSTSFDDFGVELLHSFQLDFFKIPSGEVTNLPYLRMIASRAKKVVMSTGMCNLSEVGDALKVLLDGGLSREDIVVLHCNTEYPTPMSDVNLNAMLTIKKEFGVRVGYSDHTLGIEVPIAAVATGACVIEKHFTLDRNLPGPDHAASLLPSELVAMVKAIRNIEVAMGNGEKIPSLSESKNIPVARKSIVAKVDIKKGEVLSEDKLTVKRPGTGISPMKWDLVVNTIAAKSYSKDELI